MAWLAEARSGLERQGMAIILALDVATTVGCADGEVGAKPRIWSWFTSDAGEGRPQRLLMFAKFLRKYFDQEKCDAVFYENPMALAVMARIGAQEPTIAFLRGAIGVLEMTCAEYNKPVEGLSVQEARNSVLGWRTNKSKQKTKRRVMDEIRLLGVEPETADEADAAVLFFFAAARLNPRLAVAMTPLFRGER